MKKHTTITLSIDDCKALEKAFDIINAINKDITGGSFWTPNDILAVSYLARGEKLPETGLNAMANLLKVDGHILLEED